MKLKKFAFTEFVRAKQCCCSLVFLQQTVNYLQVVDLPGYGFAFANNEMKKQWQELMQHYLSSKRKSLKVVYLLIDSRHGLKASDREFIQLLEKYVLKGKTTKKKKY